MSNKSKQDHSFMTQLATFIVDKRHLFFLLIIVSLIFSAFSRNWVEVENDLTTFLPDDAETKLALDVMENQFTTYGTAEVMVANISYAEAEKLNDTLAEIKGVQSVAFDRTTDHYNHASALYTVTFDYDENNDECLAALDTVKEALADYDLFVSTELGNTLQETIDAEVNVIMVYVAVIVVVVLLLTSQTYGEVPVLLLTFVTAMILNQGSNFLLGKISFVSNSVTSILQLALSLDYAVILCNHFKEQHETLPIREAAITALAHSIPEISASSLTTPKLNESQIADNMVADNFTSSNMLALIVPAGDYEKEAQLLNELESYDEVDYTMGLANVEAMDGYYASWDKTDLSDLHFDTVVTADYELEYSAVMADGMRGAKPVLFAEGKYDDSAKLYYTSAESASGLTPLDGDLSRAVDEASYVQLPWLVRLTTSVSGGLVEQLHVTIPDDGQSVHTLHYLPPEVSIGKIAVYVMENGRWSKADTTQFGSYLSFDVSGSDVDIAAVSVISVWWLWGVLALVVLAITVTIIASVKKHRHRRLTRAAAKTDGQAENTSQTAEDAQAQGKKHRRKPAVMIVLILVCALAAAAVLLLPRLAARIAPYKALAELERAQELSMNVTTDGTLGDAELHTVVPVEVRNDGSSRITRAMLENVPLYYSNDMLILENGKAYGIGSMFPDYSSLLGNIAELYRSAEYTSAGDSCTVSISGAQAAELLKLLCPALSGNVESIADAYAETVIENGAVSSITVSASGSMDGAAFEISAVIDGITHSANFDIPEKVSLAAAKNNAEELPEISSDLFRIVSAWAELDGRESIVSSLRLSADCGPVVLNTSLDVSSREYDGKRIYCVGKNALKLYTDGSAVVNANGTGVTDEESQLADSANLLDAVYLACLNGDISAARDGEKYTYTVALNGDGIAQLVEIISPDASELDADFAYGTVSITIDDGSITGLSVRCTGTMQVVLVETAVSVSADVEIQNGSATQFPEKAVSALTQKIG